MTALITARRQPFHALAEARVDQPVIAVDMGYSAKQRSCGLAWSGGDRPESHTFGEAIEGAAALARRVERPVIALEAVLSTYHDPATGNPAIRGAFERGRGWYHGPGVASFAAAQRFLAKLAERLPADMTVDLAEAILSFKRTPTRHDADAQRIVNEFASAPIAHPTAGGEPASPLIAGTPAVWIFAPD